MNSQFDPQNNLNQEFEQMEQRNEDKVDDQEDEGRDEKNENSQELNYNENRLFDLIKSEQESLRDLDSENEEDIKEQEEIQEIQQEIKQIHSDKEKNQIDTESEEQSHLANILQEDLNLNKQNQEYDGVTQQPLSSDNQGVLVQSSQQYSQVPQQPLPFQTVKEKNINLSGQQSQSLMTSLNNNDRFNQYVLQSQQQQQILQHSPTKLSIQHPLQDSSFLNHKNQFLGSTTIRQRDNQISKSIVNPPSNCNQGRWSKLEHCRFLEALKIHGKNWKKVQQHVQTRTSTQARSHAQKFFVKLDRKNIDLQSFLNNLDFKNINNMTNELLEFEDEDDQIENNSDKIGSKRKFNTSIDKNSLSQPSIDQKEMKKSGILMQDQLSNQDNKKVESQQDFGKMIEKKQQSETIKISNSNPQIFKTITVSSNNKGEQINDQQKKIQQNIIMNKTSNEIEIQKNNQQNQQVVLPMNMNEIQQFSIQMGEEQLQNIQNQIQINQSDANQLPLDNSSGLSQKQDDDNQAKNTFIQIKTHDSNNSQKSDKNRNSAFNIVNQQPNPQSNMFKQESLQQVQSTYQPQNYAHQQMQNQMGYYGQQQMPFQQYMYNPQGGIQYLMPQHQQLYYPQIIYSLNPQIDMYDPTQVHMAMNQPIVLAPCDDQQLGQLYQNPLQFLNMPTTQPYDFSQYFNQNHNFQPQQ